MLQALVPTIAPDGPSTPFGSTGLAIVDTIRIVVIVASIFVLVLVPVIAYVSRNFGATTRTICMGMLAFIAASLEYEHLGDNANWRLPISVLATVGAAWGMWSFFRFEHPIRRAYELAVEEAARPHPLADPSPLDGES
jgi:hypothetical protein